MVTPDVYSYRIEICTPGVSGGLSGTANRRSSGGARLRSHRQAITEARTRKPTSHAAYSFLCTPARHTHLITPMIQPGRKPAHLLAYGHSNQATFRHQTVQSSYDVISVPGTIATYYQQATGGFVIALNKPYFIDPRTPLFQQNLRGDEIRASFYTLASAHGQTIENAVDRASTTDSGVWELVQEAYDPHETAQSWLDYQRRYVQGSSEKIDHYSRLIGKPLNHPQSPAFLTNPYWMSEHVASKEWAMTKDTIVAINSMVRTDERLIPIVAWRRSAGSNWSDLHKIIDDMHAIDTDRMLLWIDDYRELDEDVDQLRALRETVSSYSSKGLAIGMLYGGFFSLLLGKTGLWAFGNGVGYSEYRAFPELPATGAPPARYYVYGLHRYHQRDVAVQLLNHAKNRFRIPDHLNSPFEGKDPATLSYHELMTHFVFSRGAEVATVAGLDLPDLQAELVGTADFVESHSVLSRLVDVDYLRTWAEALS